MSLFKSLCDQWQDSEKKILCNMVPLHRQPLYTTEVVAMLELFGHNLYLAVTNAISWTGQPARKTLQEQLTELQLS